MPLPLYPMASEKSVGAVTADGWNGAVLLTSGKRSAVFNPGCAARLSTAWKVPVGTLPIVVSANNLAQPAEFELAVFTHAARTSPTVFSRVAGSTSPGRALVVRAEIELKSMMLFAGPKALFSPIRLVKVVPMPVLDAVTEEKGASA